MFLLNMLAAAGISFIFTIIFAGGVRRYQDMPVFLWFFVLIFLLTWAGGLWMAPFGPPFLGVLWFTYFCIALVVTLLLVTLTLLGRPRRHPSGATTPEPREDMADFAAFKLFIWIMIVLLVLAVAPRYYTV